jgi:predicted methyltransferase
VWVELGHLPPTPQAVAAEEAVQKRDTHRTEPPQSKLEVRKALNVEAAGDAAAKRRAILLRAIKDGGMFGIEEHSMKNIQGAGRGLALQQDLQELARSGVVERKPGRRWVAVIR